MNLLPIFQKRSLRLGFSMLESTHLTNSWSWCVAELKKTRSITDDSILCDKFTQLTELTVQQPSVSKNRKRKPWSTIHNNNKLVTSQDLLRIAEENQAATSNKKNQKQEPNGKKRKRTSELKEVEGAKNIRPWRGRRSKKWRRQNVKTTRLRFATPLPAAQLRVGRPVLTVNLTDCALNTN